MAKLIDARGLSCPAPVLLVKNTLEQENLQELRVLVDDDACRENVTRFLGSQNFSVIDTRQGNQIQLDARRAFSSPAVEVKPITSETGEHPDRKKILILVTSDRLGSGDASLGQKLMINYLKTIKEMSNDLWQLVFVNSGVKLTTDSSTVLQELQDYQRAGVHILACGTCLEHFQLTAAKKVGETTNMLDIVSATQLADKVITVG